MAGLKKPKTLFFNDRINLTPTENARVCTHFKAESAVPILQLGDESAARRPMPALLTAGRVPGAGSSKGRGRLASGPIGPGARPCCQCLAHYRASGAATLEAIATALNERGV